MSFLEIIRGIERPSIGATSAELQEYLRKLETRRHSIYERMKRARLTEMMRLQAQLSIINAEINETRVRLRIKMAMEKGLGR